jgi:hypothetical protein
MNMNVVALNEAQRHAFGIIGGAAFGLERQILVKLAKELIAMGLVTTGGAHSGHNRSAYRWQLTEDGQTLFVAFVKAGAYPLAKHTAAGRAVLAT